MRFFWGATIACSVLAGFVILLTLVGTRSAPQEAAGYAMACALVVVPYVFARALQAFHAPDAGESIKFLVRAIDRTHPTHDEYDNKATRPPA